MKLANVKEKLALIYGADRAEQIFPQIEDLVGKYRQTDKAHTDHDWLNEQDVMMITYGDQILEEGKPPLQSLHEFARKYLQDIFSAIHILPFYPYSSDDGFSVIDYWQVNPKLGGWQDIQNLAGDFELMFDGVINHISAQSNWFQQYLEGNPSYQDFFIEADPQEDYSTVTRPRALPLLTPFETARGEKHIWTTFSPDQIDLNYRSEQVLLNIIELLLFYVRNGARFIRLDAIGYLWKELGTTCIHLEQAHQVIQIMRAILEEAAPSTIIITETNVPHAENISYFGDGFNEAHMVYQFPLPPLTLHSFITEDTSKLTQWAKSLENLSDNTTYFNFLASHDGIGLMPAKGILSEQEIQMMVDKVKQRGGLISYKANGNGTNSPYELNVNYLDALSDPGEEQSSKVKRFVASQAILLSLQGVPGIYAHSILGSQNYYQGVEESGINRRINREKLRRDQLEAELANPDDLRSQVFTQYSRLIKLRRSEEAFHPNAKQRVLDLGSQVFALLRGEGSEQVLCIINVSSKSCRLKLDQRNLTIGANLQDLVSGKSYDLANDQLVAEPYQVLWLKSKSNKEKTGKEPFSKD